MSKLERLLNLVAALLDTDRPLTFDEIIHRVEGYPEAGDATRRAFERDKEALRQMGIPISMSELMISEPPSVGYRIDRKEYAGNDPDLTPDELAALHVAASMIRLDGVDGTEAMTRIGGVAGSDDAAAEAGQLVALPTDPNLAPLFTAATEHRSVRLRYGGTDRVIDPWRISFLRGRWYVKGYDHKRRAERMYRVDRIEGSATLGGQAQHERPTNPDPIRMAGWELGDEEPVVARVVVDAAQASWAKHYVGRDAVVDEAPDGELLLELTVRNREAFRSFVLTFLDGAEVVSPPELRDDVVAWLHDVIARAS